MRRRLEAGGLEVAYGRVTVLAGVDFHVGAGEVVALLGTNGAGKSTLLRTLSGILTPSGGRVVLDGDDITGLRPAEIVRRGMVQMPGGRATFPGLTVRENLVIGGTLAAPAEREQRVEDVLGRFPWLSARTDQLAGSLSGGQQQMLALARALIARPNVLMIDELSLGLAPTVVAELLEVVTALRDDGVSVVIVDQHVNLALSFSDRAYFLERGRVRFEGPAAALAGRDDLLRAVFFAGATA